MFGTDFGFEETQGGVPFIKNVLNAFSDPIRPPSFGIIDLILGLILLFLLFLFKRSSIKELGF